MEKANNLQGYCWSNPCERELSGPESLMK